MSEPVDCVRPKVTAAAMARFPFMTTSVGEVEPVMLDNVRKRVRAPEAHGVLILRSPH